MSKVEVFRQHHFEDVEQQHEASWLGMWVFLATEVMFFGGMFACYFVYRHWYLQAFAAASNHLDVLLGGINTAVLICSSFTMALAVHSAETNKRNAIDHLLGLDHRFGNGVSRYQVFRISLKVRRASRAGQRFRVSGAVRAPGGDLFFFLLCHDGNACRAYDYWNRTVDGANSSGETRPLFGFLSYSR